jgi:23S rRNA (uracil1939-C5)-methyltransferase
MAKTFANNTAELTVERMANDGTAVAHADDGRVVFVRGGAPGDRVLAAIDEDKGSLLRAHIVELLEPSEVRATPACQLVGECGGCPWMHLRYEAQLAAKRASVVDALQRIGGFASEQAETMVGQVVPNARQLHYRNKLELGAVNTRKQGFILGLHAHSSHKLVTVGKCLLAHKVIAACPKALRGALSYAQGSGNLGIYRVGVRHSEATGETEVALWTPPGAFPRAQVAKIIGGAMKVTSIVRVLATPGKARNKPKVEVLAGSGNWREELGEFTFATSAPAFFQVNTAQATRMVELVADGLELDGLSSLVDLYAGGGTFAVPLAQLALNVTAVEAQGASVRDLRRNAELNEVNVDVIGGDVERKLVELGSASGLDNVVVDPPRAGLAEGVVDALAKSRAHRIAYVSCNPATWARDIARFTTHGYRLTNATPIDLFPQTQHIEVVSILTR